MAAPAYRVLVVGEEAVARSLSGEGFAVDVRPRGLAHLDRYRAVVFADGAADTLDPAGRAALERFVNEGGGVVSVGRTGAGWPFYRDLVGAEISGYTKPRRARVLVADRVHPSTRGLPERFRTTAAWPRLKTNPRGRAHVLATVDDSTDHPIAWCQEYRGGRAFSTAIETPEHLLGGVQWAAGAREGDCGATVAANYDKVTLDSQPGEPMTLAVLPDGRVLHNARNGEVRRYDPRAGVSKIIVRIPVYDHDEEGMQSLAVDPDFERNRWVYLYYAPPLDTPPGDAPQTGEDPRFKGYNRLSRVKLAGDRLDMSTEQEILRVPTDRGACCHVAGHIDFDGHGNLYLSTGDDTDALQSDGYAPIDERPDRGPAVDAQRSAGNTNDLRGKLLRIRVKPDGSYAIPDGNLFAPGARRARPEIYLMGFRNPFRFAVDHQTGTVYLADFSPEAWTANPLRGPAGHAKWIIARRAANYGWPFCAAPDVPYRDYDFATGASGPAFDCDAPVNDSPRNTGRRILPPVAAPQVRYSYPPTPAFPELGTGGQGPMAGPVYRYDPGLASPTKWPAYFDRTPLFYEWTRDYVREFHLDRAGDLLKINPILQAIPTDNPMDMEFGPDGALYLLEYGDGWLGEAPEAQLARVDYAKGAHAPVAKASAAPTSGPTPLTVRFSSEGTRDPDPGDLIAFAWDLDGDGTTDSTEPGPSHAYTTPGEHTARLTVTDSTGRSSVEAVRIVAGNSAPEVRIEAPVDGGFFAFGDAIRYRVAVTDPDGAVDCAAVRIDYVLGHDQHGHPLSSATGCEGTIQAHGDSGHAGMNVVGVLAATYEDRGTPPLEARAEAILQPRLKQAEHASARHAMYDAFGTLATSDRGSWFSFKPINLAGVDAIAYRVIALGSRPLTAEVRVDAPDGPAIATATIAPTGGAFAEIAAPVADPGGTHELFFVFPDAGPPGDGKLIVDSVRFGSRARRAGR